MASVLTTGCLEELIYVNCDVVQLSRVNTTYFVNCRTGGMLFLLTLNRCLSSRVVLPSSFTRSLLYR